MARNVVVLVGSLRKGSFTRRVASTIIELAAPRLSLTELEFRSLPLYDQDLDAGAPPGEWQQFRDRIRRAEAVLFTTPEYNRSMPGGLKNAIDVGSRPYGKNAWAGKPAAVVSVSPGSIGGFGANHHLRQSLVFLDMPCMPQPEMYINGADKLFDKEGKLINDATRELMNKFIAAFEGWIERYAAGAAVRAA